MFDFLASEPPNPPPPIPDDPANHHGHERDHNSGFKEALCIINFIFDGVFSICVAVAILLLILNRSIKNLPNALKLSLVLMLVTFVCYDARNVYTLNNSAWNIASNRRPFSIRIVDQIGSVLFWTNYWHFTAHYLKVGCYIRLSLTGNDLAADSEQIKRVNAILISIDIIIQFFIIAIFIIGFCDRSELM